MPELSLNDINQISRDISHEEITFSHLLENLIDHVCCDVENEMAKGLNFSEAYQIVKQKIGPRRLREIQEETLFAIDLKYRKMKTAMKISGIAGTVMFGFAALFKIQHWPGAGILMTLGAFTLAFIFMPSALVILWKETKNKRKLFLFLTTFLTGFCLIAGTLLKVQHWPFAGLFLTVGAVTGMLLFIPALLITTLNDQDNKTRNPLYFFGAAGSILFLAGFLFKIQHWPFATILMVTSIITLIIIAFPWYTWLTWREENHVNARFIYLIVGSLLIIMPSALVNLNLQHSYQEYYYPNDIQQHLLFNHLYLRNNSFIIRYHDSTNFQTIDQVHSKTVGIIKMIDNIQGKLVQESEAGRGRPVVSGNQIKQTETGQEIVYSELTWGMDPGPARNLLFQNRPTRNELNASIDEYVNFLGGIVNPESLLKYKKLLDVESFLADLDGATGAMSLMSGLHSLEILKNGVLTVEASVLNGITGNK